MMVGVPGPFLSEWLLSSLPPLLFLFIKQQSFCSEQEHLELEEAAQIPTKFNLQHLQEWGSKEVGAQISMGGYTCAWTRAGRGKVRTGTQEKYS